MPHRTHAEDSAPKPDPIALLQELHSAGGGLIAKTANAYLAEVRKDRKLESRPFASACRAFSKTPTKRMLAALELHRKTVTEK